MKNEQRIRIDIYPEDMQTAGKREKALSVISLQGNANKPHKDIASRPLGWLGSNTGKNSW